MHLHCFLLIVVSLSCGSLPPADVPLFRAAVATGAMVLAWGLLCHVAARICARQVKLDALDPMLGAELLERQLAAFRWLGLAVAVFCLGGFGLARGLDSTPMLAHSMFLQSLVLLAPGLAITAMSWSAEHRYGVLLGYTDAGFVDHVRSVWQSFRSHVAWLLVPVLVLLVLCDAIARLPVERDAAGWITAVLVLLFVPCGLPWLIQRLFPSTAIAEPTASWIGELIEAAGLGRTRLLRWETDGRTFNALVVGFLPQLRTLLVSDRLLDELPPSQVAMVVLHEAAHLKRRHVPMRMLAIVPAWVAAAVVAHVAGEMPWAMALGSGVGIVLTMWLLRVIAYRTEHDADVEACRMAGKIAGGVPHVPATYEEACEAMTSALNRVTFDQPSSRKSTWLHPGVADRVAWMRRMRTEPARNTSQAAAVANPA